MKCLSCVRKKCSIIQHMSIDKHIKGLEMKKANNTKEKLRIFISTNSFNKDLCFVMLSANISQAKLKRSNVQHFLKKYMS